MSERRPSVFISYSHNDWEWKDKLVRQLRIPAEAHGFEVWHDGQIQVGDDWRERIGAALEATQIAVLLISAEFLNSEFIKTNEIPLLLELRQQGRVEIVPVLVGACPWKSVGWLERLELRPKDGEALENLATPVANKVLVRVAEEIDAKLTQAVKRAERERGRARAAGPRATAANNASREAERPIEPQRAREQPPRAGAPISEAARPPLAQPSPQPTVAPVTPRAVPRPVATATHSRNVSRALPPAVRWSMTALGLAGLTAVGLGLYLWLHAKREPVPPSPASSPSIARSPLGFNRYEEDLGGGVKLSMVAIPGGRFKMGSPKGEAGRWDAEGPQRSVSIAPFFLGQFEITQAQWRAVARWPQVSDALKEAPSYFEGDDLPVEQVSWEDAREFCARLSRRTGRTYRLPSEAEWEYAARAGTETATYAGPMVILGDNNAPVLDGIAWYGGNSGVGFDRSDGVDSSSWREKQYQHSRAGTRLLGRKAANAWGLHDMLGNVWEWVADDWHGSYEGAPADGRAWADPTRGSARVFRGGSWSGLARYVRAAFRLSRAPDGRYGLLGFRCARVQE